MDMKILKTAAEELNEIPVFFCSFVLFCFLGFLKLERRRKRKKLLILFP